MAQYKLKIFFYFNLFSWWLAAKAQALDLDRYSNRIAGQAGYRTDLASETFLDTLIGKIIGLALGFLGLIFLILIIVSGFQWMTAGGNEDKIAEAKKRMLNATIGLAIVLAAYAISYFVYRVLSAASTGGPVTP